MAGVGTLVHRAPVRDARSTVTPAVLILCACACAGEHCVRVQGRGAAVAAVGVGIGLSGRLPVLCVQYMHAPVCVGVLQ